MSTRSNTIYDISWPDLFPGLIILRTARLALRPTVLLLASLGVTLSPLGWRCAEFCFLSGTPRSVASTPSTASATLSASASSTVTVDAEGRPIKIPHTKTLADLVERNRRWPAMPAAMSAESGFSLPDPRPWADPSRNPIVSCYHQFVTPLRVILNSSELPPRYLGYLMLGGLWSMTLWSLIAGTITRIAVVRLGLEEGTSLTAAFNFTTRRWRSHLLAPLLPLLGLALLTAIAYPLGLLMRWDGGAVLVSIIWIFVLLGGFLGALIAIGFACGWPLMWPAISAERNGDEFEALHRSLHYPLRHPARYLVYIALALVIGFLGDYVVQLLTQATVYLSDWAIATGLPGERQQALFAQPGSTSALANLSSDIIQLTKRIPAIIAIGFQYAFFWCAASAIYLTLRLDTDQAEFDQVVRDQPTTDHSLPALQTDSAGFQQLATDIKPGDSAKTESRTTPGESPDRRHEARSDGDV